MYFFKESFNTCCIIEVYFLTYIFILFLLYDCFACTCVCLLCVCLVPVEIRSGHQLLWYRGPQRLRVTLWGLRIIPGSSSRAASALHCWDISPDPELHVLISSKLLFRLILCVCVLPVCMSPTCMQCPRRPAVISRASVTGIKIAVDAANWTMVLSKSSWAISPVPYHDQHRWLLLWLLFSLPSSTFRLSYKM